MTAASSGLHGGPLGGSWGVYGSILEAMLDVLGVSWAPLGLCSGTRCPPGRKSVSEYSSTAGLGPDPTRTDPRTSSFTPLACPKHERARYCLKSCKRAAVVLEEEKEKRRRRAVQKQKEEKEQKTQCPFWFLGGPSRA